MRGPIVTIDVTVRLKVVLPDDVHADEYIQEIDYDFTPPEEWKGSLKDTEIVSFIELETAQEKSPGRA